MSEIFKIQMPLMTNEQEPKALIYNEDRSKEGLFPVDDGLVEFMDGEPKKYIKGSYNEKTGQVSIDKEVKPQNW